MNVRSENSGIIAVTGKGGVGKSTIAALIVRYLKENMPGPILAIDADPDANMATLLGIPMDTTIGDLREDVLRDIKNLPAGMSKQNYIEAGFHLRRLQRGDRLGMPHSRPMPSSGRRCHELRVPDEDQTWRIVYRTDSDAILILDVFAKKTAQTPRRVIESCRRRLTIYDGI